MTPTFTVGGGAGPAGADSLALQLGRHIQHLGRELGRFQVRPRATPLAAPPCPLVGAQGRAGGQPARGDGVAGAECATARRRPCATLQLTPRPESLALDPVHEPETMGGGPPLLAAPGASRPPLQQ